MAVCFGGLCLSKYVPFREKKISISIRFPCTDVERLPFLIAVCEHIYIYIHIAIFLYIYDDIPDTELICATSELGQVPGRAALSVKSQIVTHVMWQRPPVKLVFIISRKPVMNITLICLIISAEHQFYNNTPTYYIFPQFSLFLLIKGPWISLSHRMLSNNSIWVCLN